MYGILLSSHNFNVCILFESIFGCLQLLCVALEDVQKLRSNGLESVGPVHF